MAGRRRRRRRKLMLITGGSGFLGRELTRSHASDRWELIAPSSSSMDIRRRDSTIDAIVDWKPAAVVHLAYRKGDRPSIVDGSRNVAEAAAACGARMVHMSSDVIFAGRVAPYTEADEPFPIIEYGVDKRDAEVAVTRACPGAVLVRTSLLYGTDDLAPMQLDVQRALSGARTGSPMTFFTDEIRSPAHVADVAAAVADLANRAEVSGPLNVAGPEPVSRADFARTTARWLGHDPSGLRTGTIEEAGLIRPGRVVLDTSSAAGLGLACRSIGDSFGR